MKNDTFNLFIKSAKYYDYDNRDNLTADIPFYLEYACKAGEKPTPELIKSLLVRYENESRGVGLPQGWVPSSVFGL